jgi:hypothetical protein
MRRVIQRGMSEEKGQSREGRVRRVRPKGGFFMGMVETFALLQSFNHLLTAL